MKRKTDAYRPKRLLLWVLAISAVAVILTVAAVNMLFSDSPDIQARVVSVRTLSVSEDKNNYLLQVDGSEFGYEDNIYILITEKTAVRRSNGKSFLAESFIAGDVIEAYYADTASEKNVITAKKVVLKAH